MNVERPLPILLPRISGQRWSCHSCGDCCRSLVGHLFPHERDRLDEQGWAAELGTASYVAVGRGFVLNKRPDGACVFLDENNLCRIHRKFGEAAKPLACRIFPFSIRPAPGGWQVSLRFDCPSVTSSKGAVLRDHVDSLQRIAQEFACGMAANTDAAGRGDGAALRADEFHRGMVATAEETDMLCGRLVRWIGDSSVPLTNRLIVAARLTSALEVARLQNVRGPRFAELVNVLLRGLAAEMKDAPAKPTRRQRGLMRQFAFACSEHVSLGELRASWATRLRLRFVQLRRARAFLRGVGSAPALAGQKSTATFERIETAGLSTGEAAKIDELLTRYLIARIEGRSVFGAGYYGWPVFRGFGALWLMIAALGWLARHSAAAAGREALTFDDVAQMIGVIDRAATRLPALGTLAERTRVAYLLSDDGLARLLAAYALVPHEITGRTGSDN